MFSLKNKITLVTGAGSGIGASIAEVFAKAGAHVYVADRDEIISHTVEGIETAAALPADTDAGYVQFAVGLVSEGQLAVAENQQPGSDGG